MPTVDYTFDILSETWTEAGLTTAITAAKFTTDGSPGSSGGCLRFTSTTATNNVLERIRGPLQTWESMGVPPGAVVTGCYSLEWYIKKPSTTGGSAAQANYTMSDSANVPVLDEAMSTSGLGVGVTTQFNIFNVDGARPDVIAGKQASNTQVRLDIGLRFTSSGTVNMDFRVDAFTIRITYTLGRQTGNGLATFI